MTGVLVNTPHHHRTPPQMTGVLVNTHHHHRAPPRLPMTLLSSWLQSMDLMRGHDNENGQFLLCWSSGHTQHLCRGRQFSLLSSRTGLTVRIRDVFLPSGLGSVCKNSEHLSGASHRSHRRLQLPDGAFPDFTSASQLPLTWVCSCRYSSFMPYPTLTWWARPGFVCNSLQSHQEFLFHNVSFRDGAFGQAWPLSSHFMPLPHTTLPSDKFSLNLRKY